MKSSNQKKLSLRATNQNRKIFDNGNIVLYKINEHEFTALS